MRSIARRVLVLPALVAGLLAPSAVTHAAPHHSPAVAHAAKAKAAKATKAAPELTLQMRDLFVARPKFGTLDRLVATAILARPTNGANDPQGDGYTTRKSKELCGRRICIHYVTKGADAPPNLAWVRHTLDTMNDVWHHEVDKLGFRRPPSDGKRGGDGRFDVYLTDLGSRGLYGYCAPETKVKSQPKTASGYCVLDNDFATKQYGAPRQVSLEVTAAHEFFHAIQFGYDYRADPWLMESTAVWMEESFASSANDNRRYLPYGDVHMPGIPLDTYSSTGFAQYGNWAFWEYLTSKYGDGLIRQVWNLVDARKGAPAQASVDALRHVLNRLTGTTTGLDDALASYAVANLDPAQSYVEGRAWPAVTYADRAVMRHQHGRRTLTATVNHLAAQDLIIRPPADGTPRRLRLTVHGPRHRVRVMVTVRRSDGTTRSRRIILKRGVGVTETAFSPTLVSSVVVSLVNASSRYVCDRGTLMSCSGKPRDDGMRFSVDVQVDPPARHPHHPLHAHHQSARHG